MDAFLAADTARDVPVGQEEQFVNGFDPDKLNRAGASTGKRVRLARAVRGCPRQMLTPTPAPTSVHPAEAWRPSRGWRWWPFLRRAGESPRLTRPGGGCRPPPWEVRWPIGYVTPYCGSARRAYSRFCSDGCGVRTREVELGASVRYPEWIHSYCLL